ncbi:MAG: 3-isopropylmalate dehydrogenase, partial [Methanomicrobiales archaeon]|nr:3-isopropylmalate dehydrogenase [Methanomicrobiales archaeon]
MPRSHVVAAIAGDGIGPEVIAEGKKVLEAAGERFGFDIRWKNLDIGAERYLRTGELLTESDLSTLGGCRAIYFGAIGDERVKPGVLEKGILLSLRFHFDQYVNLRPVKLLPGVWTPLAGKGPADIDFVVVRENTEDFYVGIGSRFKGEEKRALEVVRSLYQVKFGIDAESDAEEVAYQIGIITREGARRVIRFAFDTARRRGRTPPKVTSVDKANVLTDIYGLWREVFSEVAKAYPGIPSEFSFVDAITMWFVKNPESFDVVVSPNMFGDIITDLGAMIQGGLGLAPGGNINPEGTSMFEPIHGSAPRYRGLGVANPVATIWAGSMLLDHLGEREAAAAVLDGIGSAITAGVKTRDMGGQ